MDFLTSFGDVTLDGTILEKAVFLSKGILDEIHQCINVGANGKSY